MKRFLLVLLMCAGFTVSARGQATQTVSGPVDPPTCNPANGLLFFNNSTQPGVYKFCSALNTWSPFTAASPPPVGGNGSLNFISKWTNNTTIGNSSCFDDGLNPTRCPNGMDTASGGYYAEWIVGAGGVTANALVCRSSLQTAIICPAGTTTGVLGVAQATVAATGTVEVCFAGKCSPIVSNGSTVGDWLIPSTSIAGEVDDVGATQPTTGVQTLPAETTVTAGNAVLTTFLSPDTLLASTNTGSTITPCTQFGLTYYSASGTSNVLNCITPPTANGKYLAMYNVVGNVAVAPTTALQGVPINAQTGTSYTLLYSDRASLLTLSNASPIAVTVPQAGGTGFTSNYVHAGININAGLATYTPTTSTVNGNATQIVPQNWFYFLYSDNVNYRMPVLPTIAAFPSCSGVTNALQFTTATGAFTCGTFSTGGITSINSATGPAVTVVGAGGTNVSTNTGTNTVTVASVNSGGVNNVVQYIGTTYTIPAADLGATDIFQATGVVFANLPQAGSISASPFVATRYNNNVTTCTNCTTATFANVAGNMQTVSITFVDASKTVTSVTDSSGNSYSILAPAIRDSGNQYVVQYFAQTIVVAASNAVTVHASGSIGTMGIAVHEWTTVTGFDADGSAVKATSGAPATVTLSVTYPTELSIATLNNGAVNPGVPWSVPSQYGGGINTNYVAYRVITGVNSTSSISGVAVPSGTTATLADFPVSSTASYLNGWYVIIENNPGQVVTNQYVHINPTTSTINGQATLDLYPCQGAVVRSDGTNYQASLFTIPYCMNNTNYGNAIYSVAQSAGTSSISATTITTSDNINTIYEMGAYGVVTTAGTSCVGNTTVVFNAIYTDPNAGSATTTALGTWTIATNGTVGVTNFSWPPILFRSKTPNQSIQFSTTYTGGGSCSPSPAVQITPVLSVK